MDSVGTLVEIKFLSVSCLEVRNTPGFESDEDLFFSNGNFLFQNCRPNVCLLMFCQFCCHI